MIGLRLPKQEERREKLRRYDMIAAQVLNPSGKSAIHDCGLRELWTVTKEGNKQVKYFSEFCSEDDYRRGIGISRYMEVMEAAFAAMETPEILAIIKPEIMEKLKGELEALMPSIKFLNGGKAAQETKKGIAGLSSSSHSASKRLLDSDVKLHAETIYDWLEKEDSKLRGFFAIASMGGVFYSAFAADKTACAAIDATGGKIPKSEFVQAAIARLCKGDPAPVDNSSGRFSKTTQSLLSK